MPSRKAATPKGRPPSKGLTPEQFDILADQAADTSRHFRDVAKFMRENNMKTFMVQAAKVMDEHMPIAHSFSRRCLADVGPAATAFRLGRKTVLELNQEKHDRSKRRKDQQ